MSLKCGDLVRVTPSNNSAPPSHVNNNKLSGLLLKRIENYLGSSNYFEVLIGDEIHEFHSSQIDMVDMERYEKMDRFNTNFKSIIKSTDPSASIALEGDAIIIGASTAELQQELTNMLPEEFESIPVIVVDMSAEEYES